MTPPFRIELLHAIHDRANFNCGVVALDRYFREQASQDVRRRVAACYVLVEVATQVVSGYYTLAASSVALTGMPAQLLKQLPRYPSVPAARLGRLAIACSMHGQGLGSLMVWDAARRASRSEVAMYALAVDAKGETAADFYVHLGFLPLDAPGRQLVLPLTHFSKPA